MKNLFDWKMYSNIAKKVKQENEDFIKRVTPKLTNLEIAKAEVFVDLHKCPWYKNFFNNLPKYKLKQTSTEIGPYSEIICEHCGQRYNITDYECW